MQKICVDDIKEIAYVVAKIVLEEGEEVPKFETRYRGILESCVDTPFQSFDGEELYKGFFNKVSILFYLMIKNHPFVNGNKRIAITTLLLFLYENGYWLKVELDNLYDFTKKVASSKPLDKDKMINEIEKFIKNNTERLILGK